MRLVKDWRFGVEGWKEVNIYDVVVDLSGLKVVVYLAGQPNESEDEFLHWSGE